MAAIKSLDKIAAKFVRVASSSGASYAEGVANPRVSWSAAAKAAEANYEQGVTAAIGRKSFGKGVSKAGDQKQMAGAAGKGATRFGPGAAEGGPAYQTGFGPYHAAIGSLVLPPRRARRDPSNLQRVTAVATKLGQVKEQMSKA
jgi:hypothetical protein